MNIYTAKVSSTINAPAAKVWSALIDPAMIKQYLFGTEAVSDWKEGSSITYKGVWEGKPYEDKGNIIKMIPEKLLVTTYWSGFSGLVDLPENYNTVTYELMAGDDSTTLTISQDNIATQEAQEHSEKNWTMVMDGLKKVVEGK